MIRALRRGLRGATIAALLVILPFIVCVIVVVIISYQGFWLIDRLLVLLFLHLFKLLRRKLLDLFPWNASDSAGWLFKNYLDVMAATW